MKRTSIMLIGVVFLTASWSVAQNDRSVERALAYAKRLPVSQLDPGLHKQTLAQWFKETVGPDAEIGWEVNDCGEQTGGDNQKGRDIPTCVEAKAALSDGRTVIVRIAVGTLGKGIWGRPVVYYSVVLDKNETRDVKNLRDLPRILSRKAN